MRGVPPVGTASIVTTRTETVTGNGPSHPSSVLSSNAATGLSSAGLFEAPHPVSLGSLTDPGGGVVSIDTGDFDATGHLDVAAITCDQCTSPYPWPYQNSASGLDEVAVLVGHGDGTFGAPTVLKPVGQGVPLSMILAKDVGNGHTDLIVSQGAASSGSVKIFIYLGNGDGTFQTPPIAVTSPAPVARMQAAALGDGHLDLVAEVTGSGAGATGNAIVVFTGDGTGNFTAGTPIPIPGGTPTDLAVAPLANGGASDILATVITSNKNTSLSVLVNNGSGGFPAIPSHPDAEISAPMGIEVGNFDGPTQPPGVLLAGDSCPNSFDTSACQVLLPGDGDGTFAVPTTSDATPLDDYSTRGPEDDAPINLTGIGHLDGVWIPTAYDEGPNNEIVQIASGDGNGGFSTQDVVGTSTSNVVETAVLPAALTSGAPPDLLVAGTLNYGEPATDDPASGLWVVPSNPKVPGTYETGQGVFEEPITASSNVWSLTDQSTAAGDFANDGHQDLVTVDCDSVFLGYCQHININRLPGNGDGTFGATSVQSFSVNDVTPTIGLVSGNFSAAANGHLDIASIYSNIGGAAGLMYLMGNGDGTFAAPVFVPAGNATVGGATLGTLIATHLNGKTDLVASVQTGSGEYLESWLWNGTTFSPPVVSGPLPQFYTDDDVIAVGDFSSAGVPDVVEMATPPGGGPESVEVLTGDDTGAFDTASPTVVAAACPGTFADGAVAAGDLTGDGHDDLLWQCNSALYVALGNGDGTFQTAQSYPEGSPGQNDHLFLADVEGNGHLDAVAYGTGCPCQTPYGVDVWHNNGDGTFAAGQAYSVGNQIYQGFVTTAALSSSATQDLIAVDGNAGSDDSVGADLITILQATAGRPALEVTAVSAPVPAVPAPGQIVTGSFTVKDTGAATDSTWDDSVYLAPGGSGASYTTSDTLLERIPETETLAPNDSYAGTYSFPLPDLATGSYHLIVVPDSGDALNGADETPAASPSFTVGPIPTLAAGGSVSTTIQQGQELYYQVPVTSASDVALKLSGLVSGADVTILAEPDAVPTPESATTGSVTGSIVLPSSDPGTWFVVVQPATALGTSPVPVTVSAGGDGLTLTGVSPSTDGIPIVYPALASVGASASARLHPLNSYSGSLPPIPPSGDGQITITLRGSGFGTDLGVKLVDGSTTLTATSVTRRDSTVAFASFPIASSCIFYSSASCGGGPLLGPTMPELGTGTYTAEVTSGGASAMLPGALVISPTGQTVEQNALSVSISAPSLLRDGWAGALTVTLTNNTSQDLAVPVISVSSLDALLGAPGVNNTADFTPDVEIDDPVLSADPAINPSPPGILPGGATTSIEIGIVSNTTLAHVSLATVTSIVNSSDTTSIDWPSELAPYEPPGMNASDWSGVVAAFSSDYGRTEGAFALSLVDAFAAAKADGVTLASEGDAINFLVDEEVATDPAAPVSGTLDLGGPDNPLGHVALTLTRTTGSATFSATSWYDGRFSFFDVPAGTYDLDAAGYLPRPIETVDVAPTATGLVATGLVGATLSGTVTQLGSTTPVDGAIVTATDPAGTLESEPTGTDGTYAISGLEAGPVTVAVNAPGFEAATRLSTTVANGTPTTLDVSLAQEGEIAGTLSAPGGGAPAGGTVNAELVSGGPIVDGSVNSDGSYTIAELAPGAYSVVGEAPGDGPAEQTPVAVTAGATAGGVGLQLTDTPATVSGVVTDTDTGDPVTGASVSTDVANGAGGPVTTAADGSYTLTGLPSGNATLSIVPPDTSHISTSTGVTATAGSTATANVSLDPAGSVEVTVDDGDGVTPLVGATVEVVGPSPRTTDTPTETQTSVTDSSGDASLSGLAAGNYDAQIAGSDAHQEFTIGSGTRDASLSLSVPTGTVSGVVDTSAGQPAVGVEVALADASGQIASTETDANGKYAFTVTASGSLDVIASDPSIGVLEEDGVSVTTGGTTNVPTMEAGSASLAVAVTAGGAPVAAAVVTLSTGAMNDQPAWVVSSTDGSGSAVFDNLTPGSYELEVSDGTHAADFQSVTVSAGPNAAPVAMGAAGALSGTVDNDATAPVAGATVTATGSSPDLLFSTTTAADGSYTLSGLLPGSYDVSVGASGTAPDDVTGVGVSAGSTTSQDITLETSGSTLDVELTANGGGPLPTVTATLEDTFGVPVAASTFRGAETASDPGAGTAFSPLAPGSYTLALSGPGRATTTEAVSVGAGTTSATITVPAAEVLPSVGATTVSSAAIGADVASRSSMSSALIRHLQPNGSSGPGAWASAQFFMQDWSTLIPNPNTDQLNPYPPGGFDTPSNELSSLQGVIANFANEASPHATSCANPYLAKASLYAQLAQQALNHWMADYAIIQNQAFDSEVEIAKQAAFSIGAIVSLAAALAAIAPVAAALGIAGAGVAGVTGATVGTELTTALAAISGGELLNQAVDGFSSLDANGVLSNLNNVQSLVTTALSELAKQGTAGTLTKVGSVAGNIGGHFTNFLNALTSAISLVQALQGAMSQLTLTARDAAAAEGNFWNYLSYANQALTGAFQYQCPPKPPYPPPPPPQPVPEYHYPQPQNIRPNDPNELIGPTGDGSAGQYVEPGTSLPYTVLFQNDGSAPATEVTVAVTLPPGTDPSSLELTGFGFGQTSVPIPATPSFSRTLTGLGLSNGDEVSAAGSYDGATHTVTWTIDAVNPATGDVDGSPTGGFLPPDDAAGDGEGYVSFAVNAGVTDVTGMQIKTSASVVFDKNSAITTNTWTNTVDSAPPTATLGALPATETGPFAVTWSGATPGSPIASEEIYVSDDDGPFTLWQASASAGSATYPGVIDHTYSFIATATDELGNTQSFPTAFEAATSVVAATSPTPPDTTPTTTPDTTPATTPDTTPTATTVAPTTTTIPSFRPGLGPTVLPSPTIKVHGTALGVIKGHVDLDLACSDATCSGSVSLDQSHVVTSKRGKTTIHTTVEVSFGSHTFSIKSGKSTTVVLAMNKTGLAALGAASARHPMHLEVIITLKGKAHATDVTVT